MTDSLAVSFPAFPLVQQLGHVSVTNAAVMHTDVMPRTLAGLVKRMQVVMKVPTEFTRVTCWEIIAPKILELLVATYNIQLPIVGFITATVERDLWRYQLYISVVEFL